MLSKVIKLTTIAIFSTVLFVQLMSCLSTNSSGNKELADVYYNWGNALSELEHYDEALKAYANAWRLDSSFAAAGYNLVRVYIYLEKFTKAEVLLSKLMEKDPRNILLLEVAGFLYHKKHDYDSALSYYNRVLSADSVNSNALYNTFLIFKTQGNQKAALEQLKKYIVLNESDYNSIAVLATLYQEQKEYDLAIENYRLYLDKSSDEKRKGEVEILLASLFLDRKLYGQAYELLKKLTDTEEPNAALVFKKAWTLLVGIEDYEKGMAALKVAIDSGFKDRELAADLAAIDDALYHDEIVTFLKENKLID